MFRLGVAFVLFAWTGCQKPTPAGARNEQTAETAANLTAETGARPTAEAAGNRQRFAVIGDYGADTPSEALVAALVKGFSPDFIITTGDNNYPIGAESSIDANIGKFYADFIAHYVGHFGRGSVVNRFWPSPGNHDWMTGDLAPYRAYFTLPGNERYYDVDLGLVHLYALDSDTHEPDGTSADSAQANWLKQRLLGSKSCYDIVYFHHPPYSTATHGPSYYMRWPFRAWGAEAVLAGHDHTYERFEIDGIWYFVNGLGGASRYEFVPERGTGSAYRYNAGYGAMLVTATPSEINFEFITTDGVRRDSAQSPAQCRP